MQLVVFAMKRRDFLQTVAAAGLALVAHPPLQFRPTGPVYEYTLSWWEITVGSGQADWRRCWCQLTRAQVDAVTGPLDLMRRYIANGRQSVVIRGEGYRLEPHG